LGDGLRFDIERIEVDLPFGRLCQRRSTYHGEQEHDGQQIPGMVAECHARTERGMRHAMVLQIEPEGWKEGFRVGGHGNPMTACAERLSCSFPRFLFSFRRFARPAFAAKYAKAILLIRV